MCQAICEDFATEIFNRADDEDRAGTADKCVLCVGASMVKDADGLCGGGGRTTAKTFYAAGTFFDILNQFGDISEEVRRLVSSNIAIGLLDG